MDELKLSTAVPAYPGAEEITDKERLKKKRGCGCLLMGCFAIILLIALPPIAGLVYLGTLSDSDYGSYVVKILKHPEVAKGVKQSIEESSDLSPEQKNAVIQAYDALLNKYDQLPADKQDAVNRNIVTVVRKAIQDPEAFSKEPPPELMDIFVTLDIGSSFIAPPPTTPNAVPVPAPPSNAPPTAPSVPEPTPLVPAPPQTQNPQDPYSFDLPAQVDSQAKDEVESSQYDF